MPISPTSAASSGGVFSSTLCVASHITSSGSSSASSTSSDPTSTVLGRPVTRSRPLHRVFSGSSSANAMPTSRLSFSAVLSPMKRLYFFLMYFTIQSSNLSPATLTDALLTMPPIDITAISVVPPPISIIMMPSGALISMPAPIAAATGSSIRYTALPPACSAASFTARFSTSVTPLGTHTTSLGLKNRLPPHVFFIKYCSIFSVTS